MNLNILDALCGQGKTEAMINYINDKSNDKKRILYITPFLTEIERIKESCPSRHFKSPQVKGSKMYNFKYLLSKGENIVASHALFKRFDQEIIDITLLNDYILIMDEVADVAEVSNISSFDLDTLLEKYVEIGSKGKLKWISEEYVGEFIDYKRQCELGSLYLYPIDYKSKRVKPSLIWIFPIEIFKAFKEVFILTYLFDAQIQKYYYDYFNITYKNWYIDNFTLTDKKQEYDLDKYVNLIDICEHEKLNKIGENDGSLSFTWFKRNKNNIVIKTLKRNCENYFKNIEKSTSHNNMWTTFKEYKNEIKGKGYTKGFVSISTRATNLYIDKSCIAYLSNRYMNPIIKNFFSYHGINVNEDNFALSELLQFVFRSRIRKGEPISIYVPSLRMRNLLKNWIKNFL